MLYDRPTRAVTWVLVVVADLLALYGLLVAEPLTGQVIKAWSLIAAALFLLLVQDASRRALDSALGAGIGAAVAVLGWFRAYRFDPALVMTELRQASTSMYQAMGDASPENRERLAQSAELMAPVTALMPAFFFLAGVSGLLLAWRWYHIFAAEPAGIPPRPFREFTFSDHFLWVLVLGLAGTVAQVAGVLPAGDIWPANTLAVAAGLYSARGLAVLWSITGRWSPPVLLVATLAVLFLSPLVFTGLLGVGVADTWLDFRRRAAAALGD